MQYMVDQEAAVASKRGREAGLEAARAAFYRGDIAQKIVKFQKENGGFLSAAEDLADYRSGIASPVETSFGDIRLYGCGPWCQGPSLLQALNLLDAARDAQSRPQFARLPASHCRGGEARIRRP